jgi:hypothetical protein
MNFEKKYNKYKLKYFNKLKGGVDEYDPDLMSRLQKKNCPICETYLVINNSFDIAILNCKCKLYHRKCILENLFKGSICNKKFKCPYCKLDIKEMRFTDNISVPTEPTPPTPPTPYYKNAETSRNETLKIPHFETQETPPILPTPQTPRFGLQKYNI